MALTFGWLAIWSPLSGLALLMVRIHNLAEFDSRDTVLRTTSSLSESDWVYTARRQVR